jgi:penicillin-binding protein 1C
LLLRSVFAELARDADTRPLYLSPKLVRGEACVPVPLRTADTDECLRRAEWFLPGDAHSVEAVAVNEPRDAIRLRRPTPGLQLAYDPRLPKEAQAFEFALQGVEPADRVLWTVDGQEYEKSGATYRWPVTRGEHRVAAAVWRGGEIIADLPGTAFVVK